MFMIEMNLKSFFWCAIFILCALLLAADAPATAAESAQTLRFSAIPDQNSTELEEKFRPFAAYLSEKLEVPARYVPSRDYQASVEMFKNGDVDMVWFGGLTGVQARAAVPGARAIAQGDADPHYYSYFIANPSTGLARSDDFPQQISKYAFTFGSESSTSGRLMPEFFIRKFTGKSPADFFEKPVGFSGSHDKTIELVESGQYQVGVVNYKVFDQRLAEGKFSEDKVKIVWQTPEYADYHWTVHPDLEKRFGAGFTERLTTALVEIADPKLLLALPRNKLIPARNEEFEGIYAVAKELKMVR